MAAMQAACAALNAPDQTTEAQAQQQVAIQNLVVVIQPLAK
ncbi:MAG TPA: hypothetical protein VG733_14135 [Chthoniobacteraceae bacterium]|nr:hypothetical protein [Chthoniobacteraceae bacterium]